MSDSSPYAAPVADLERKLVYCRECGNSLALTAATCPACGAEQNLGGRSKWVAAALAFFLGGFGAHRFYLGQWWGIVYLLLFWTWIPALVALVEMIVFMVTPDEKWQAKYANVKGAGAGVIVLVVFGGLFMVGILAAIAIPAYQDYIEQAQSSPVRD